ncbi:hypothetical protein PENTCL1PPCAC_5581, partial [Pristionchus entomophagus]
SSPLLDDEKLLSVSAPAAFASRLGKVPRWTRKPPVQADRRVSYEHMLVRYGSWSNVRGQVLAYTALIFIAFIYKSHSDFVHFTEFMPMIKEGKHIHCCCETRARKWLFIKMNQQFNVDRFLDISKHLFGLVFSITCPLWERYIGRHAALLVTVLTGMFCSILLIFSLPTDVLQLVHVMLNLCSAFTGLISMVNISEMLPYHLRFLSVAIFTFATTLEDAIATLHFFFGFKVESPLLDIFSEPF